jgi:lipopolysaccharide export system protein LptA
LAVQDAHATSRPGQLVELKSDAEVLHAMGSDFFYDARTKESVLKGDPEMVALKDGHEIHARELRMENAGQKDIQKAKARGPGRIAMLDAKSGKRTMHARWKDELDFNKEGANDCLTLTGGAAFADAEQGWQLRADRLKLWLQPAAQALAGAVPQRNKPHHLEATGHVTGGSPDLHIKEPTEHLMIWFKDAPAGAAPPARAAADRGAPAEKSPQPLPSGGRQPPEPASAQGANAPRSGGLGTSVLGTLPGSPRPQGQAAADPNAKKPPMELSARTVDAYVLRTGERNDLERLWCQGDVHVHQEPAAPDDRGVDILGETLQLDHAPDGSVMVVTGHLGQVQMNKICILGPEILIDQKRNTAKVNGVGAMQMLTKSSLEGEPLAEPTELTVNWDKEMFFNGQYAVFQGGPGGIQAEQVNSRLRCKEMQVFLDRPVSFKEGDKGGQPAKVKNLVCDKKVVIEDTTREGPELRRYTRLTSPSVALDNESGEVRASGPGVVHILQLEAEDEGPLGNPAPARPPAGWPNGPTKKDVPPDEPAKKDPPADDPAKKEAAKRLVLTRVQYLASMYANNRARTAIFRGDVDTVHVPTDNPDLVVDLDRLPPGGMHMHCELLRVFNRRRADGTMTQEMEAVGKVYINAQEFWGQAHTVKFDEAKDLIILEGKDGGKASLYQVKGQGGKPSEMIARKIYFWRKTNKVHFEGGQVISVNQ